MIDKPAITIDHLTVALTGRLANADILSEWVWLIGSAMKPLLFAACGNVFVEDSGDGTVHFLDVSAAQLSPIANTVQDFESLRFEPAFIDAYLYPEQVASLRRHGQILKPDQIYSFRVPLSLGGDATVENIEIADIDVHFSIAGQIECQIADVPTGTPITGLKIKRIPRPNAWWKFW